MNFQLSKLLILKAFDNVSKIRHLINEKDPRDKLCHTIVDVLVHHLVDLPPQLVCDLRLLWLHQLTHHGHDVLPPLGPSVGHVQIM